MRLIQVLDAAGAARVGVIAADGDTVQLLDGWSHSYDLAVAAIAQGVTLDALAASAIGSQTLSYRDALAAQRVLAPLMHPDPAHCHVTGTGLTHLGSAAARDAMHKSLQQDAAAMTDSMRMFKMGVESGIPQDDRPGAQPEWFYKGDGGIVVAPGAPLPSPDFALDSGEEPELVGLYVIGADGTPHRLGFAIGNEFSDHITERQNYLYLAHSKLRYCSLGPELRTGELPADLRGTSRVRRGDAVVWERPFLTGEANMCHSLANLEYHHFKYAAHRRPGDVHLHYFGTATLSFTDGVSTVEGDRFEIDLPDLGAPLVNPIAIVDSGFALGGVRPL
ncbi:AraD1 family protein [Solimonas marina]|uniref:FAH family protein n=1 Tax=Solimonas marina TaxID=2714601 RepID=A0A969WBN2_9GAMM|nr:AraD1 family protein [Solimonas marina]NKF24197.1 FAH family protein [Solimonas marina]